MKITPDTNLLIRTVMQDHSEQADLAVAMLERADVVALSSACLCEVFWVLRSVYKMNRADIAVAIDSLISASNVRCSRNTVEFGLEVLAEGGDFADGVVAYEGRWHGGETFVSFDRKVVTIMKRCGLQAERV